VKARKKRALTQSEKRALASAGLTVVRYQPDGERAEIRQLSPEGLERRRDFIRRLTDDTPASEGSE
jgi:hypothetical protein